MARATLLLLAVLLALGLAEAGARALQPARAAPLEPGEGPLQAAAPRPAAEAGRPHWRAFSPPASVFERDPVIGYHFRPHVSASIRNPEHAGGGFELRTNGYGLRRDEEVAIPKPPGLFRVLVLGDSQTQGYGTNDEHYPARLEAALRTHAGGRPIEVLNAGVDGYAPHQAYLWYRERGVALEPDLVVLGVYAGNDIMEMTSKLVSPVVVDADADRLRPWSAPGDWLLAHSRLYQLARQTAFAGPLTERLTRLGLVSHPPAPRPAVLAELLDECHGCWLQHFKQPFQLRATPGLAERELARLETLFGLLDRQVAARGGRLVVLALPTKAQVEPHDDRGVVRRIANRLELAEDDLAFNDGVYAGILAAAARAGVPAIDPRPALAAAAAGERLYYRRDWHLNPAGNRVLGELLAAALLERGLVPVG